MIFFGCKLAARFYIARTTEAIFGSCGDAIAYHWARVDDGTRPATFVRLLISSSLIRPRASAARLSEGQEIVTLNTSVPGVDSGVSPRASGPEAERRVIGPGHKV